MWLYVIGVWRNSSHLVILLGSSSLSWQNDTVVDMLEGKSCLSFLWTWLRGKFRSRIWLCCGIWPSFGLGWLRYFWRIALSRNSKQPFQSLVSCPRWWEFSPKNKLQNEFLNPDSFTEGESEGEEEYVDVYEPGLGFNGAQMTITRVNSARLLHTY